MLSWGGKKYRVFEKNSLVDDLAAGSHIGGRFDRNLDLDKLGN
jgi:hypothetical protein